MNNHKTKVMKTLILLIGLSLSTICLGQDYKTALGIKGGYFFTGSGAISLKHFMSTFDAVEVNLGAGRNHLWVQALYERNQSFAGAEGLDWYWGVGGDLGVWSTERYPYRDVYYTGAWGGFDALIGLEYTVPSLPLNFALDAGPSIRLFPYVGVGVSSALAVRYAFK